MLPKLIPISYALHGPGIMLLLSVQDENQEAIGFRMDKGEMENGKIMDFRK